MAARDSGAAKSPQVDDRVLRFYFPAVGKDGVVVAVEITLGAVDGFAESERDWLGLGHARQVAQTLTRKVFPGRRWRFDPDLSDETSEHSAQLVAFLATIAKDKCLPFAVTAIPETIWATGAFRDHELRQDMLLTGGLPKLEAFRKAVKNGTRAVFIVPSVLVQAAKNLGLNVLSLSEVQHVAHDVEYWSTHRSAVICVGPSNDALKCLAEVLFDARDERELPTVSPPVQTQRQEAGDVERARILRRWRVMLTLALGVVVAAATVWAIAVSRLRVDAPPTETAHELSQRLPGGEYSTLKAGLWLKTSQPGTPSCHEERWYEYHPSRSTQNVPIGTQRVALCTDAVGGLVSIRWNGRFVEASDDSWIYFRGSMRTEPEQLEDLAVVSARVSYCGGTDSAQFTLLLDPLIEYRVQLPHELCEEGPGAFKRPRAIALVDPRAPHESIPGTFQSAQYFGEVNDERWGLVHLVPLGNARDWIRGDWRGGERTRDPTGGRTTTLRMVGLSVTDAGDLHIQRWEEGSCNLSRVIADRTPPCWCGKCEGYGRFYLCGNDEENLTHVEGILDKNWKWNEDGVIRLRVWLDYGAATKPRWHGFGPREWPAQGCPR